MAVAPSKIGLGGGCHWCTEGVWELQEAELHDSPCSGHLGVIRTYTRVKQRF